MKCCDVNERSESGDQYGETWVYTCNIGVRSGVWRTQHDTIGRIHIVENIPLVAATSGLYAAPTRDLAAGDENLPEGFCRGIERLISYFGTIFHVKFNFNLL